MAGVILNGRLQQRRTRLLLVAVVLMLAFLYFTFDRWEPYDQAGVPVKLGNPPPPPPPRPTTAEAVDHMPVQSVAEKPPPPAAMTPTAQPTPDAESEVEPTPAAKTPRPTSPDEVLSSASPATAAGGAAASPHAGAESAASPAAAEAPTAATRAAASPSETTSWTPEMCAGFNFERWQSQRPGPESEGRRKFPLVRPPVECRTFVLPAMEELIESTKKKIADPDLARLFENAYPNTLDTMVKWRGYANKTDEEKGTWALTDEELTYVITGDIDAMWLRDSASQIYSYLPLLEASKEADSLASLWRGLINSHSRYIVISPYCHSFQPPVESGIAPTQNGAYSQNHPQPGYDPLLVFDCKWELDSLASFLQISAAYYEKTSDAKFFGKYSWVDAVEAAVDAAGAMRLGTYSEEGKVEASAWTFTGWTNRGSETLTNDGLGNPTKQNGMIRTGFRPSDDACIFQLLVPANMMFAKYLEEASIIMEQLDGEKAKNLTWAMREMAYGIRVGIDDDAVKRHGEFGDIFAYEIDGFGGATLMDDANVPSLLAMPLWNYTSSSFNLPAPREGFYPHDYEVVYQNTRKFVQSDANPYFMRGPVISAVGGPHLGPGRAWPMAAIVVALTAYDPISGVADVAKEVGEQLMMVLNSTDGTGVVHETVNSWDEKNWTRAWFGWANGLFGELILKIAAVDEAAGVKDGLLTKSWQ